MLHLHDLLNIFSDLSKKNKRVLFDFLSDENNYRQTEEMKEFVDFLKEMKEDLFYEDDFIEEEKHYVYDTPKKKENNMLSEEEKEKTFELIMEYANKYFEEIGQEYIVNNTLDRNFYNHYQKHYNMDFETFKKNLESEPELKEVIKENQVLGGFFQYRIILFAYACLIKTPEKFRMYWMYQQIELDTITTPLGI